jgi:hypothetical protein
MRINSIGIHDCQCVFKSAIEDYYESKPHDILMAEFKKEIQFKGLIKLFEQYLQRLELVSQSFSK